MHTSGQLAPGYLSECDSRCMEGVLKRDYPSGGRHAKRKSIGRDSIIAGDGKNTKKKTLY